MNALNNIWDKKSKNYNKFDGNLNEFQVEFFNLLDKFNVDFTNKNIVDIGAGTGIYSLYLAKICKSVVAVDGSSGMLAELKNSAVEFNITNIKTICREFNGYKTGEKFDIAFLTMSPALGNRADFIKFISLGKLRIYMNWEYPRSSSMLEPFFQKYGKNSWKKVTASFRNLLDEMDILYKTAVLKEERKTIRSFDESVENVLWHLEINGFSYNKNDIVEMLKLQEKDGLIEDNICSTMRVMVF